MSGAATQPEQFSLLLTLRRPFARRSSLSWPILHVCRACIARKEWSSCIDVSGGMFCSHCGFLVGTRAASRRWAQLGQCRSNQPRQHLDQRFQCRPMMLEILTVSVGEHPIHQRETPGDGRGRRRK